MCCRASSSRSEKTGMRFRRALSKGALLRVRSLSARHPSRNRRHVPPGTTKGGPEAALRTHLAPAARLLGLRAVRARRVGLAGEDLLLGGLLATRGAHADRLFWRLCGAP